MHGKVIRGYSKYCVDKHGNVLYTSGPRTKKKSEIINGNIKFILKSDTLGLRGIFDIEQCICLAYFPHYEYGDTIQFKDKNSKNIHFSNLIIKKARVVELYSSKADLANIKSWGLKSKCSSANRRTSIGTILVSEVYKSLLVNQFKCFYCLDDLNCNNWHLDHFLPICKGGSNSFNNIRPSCPTCNMMKGILTIGQFRNKVNHLYESLSQIGDGNEKIELNYHK